MPTLSKVFKKRHFKNQINLATSIYLEQCPVLWTADNTLPFFLLIYKGSAFQSVSFVTTYVRFNPRLANLY